LLGPGLFFIFLILYTVGRTPWTENQLVARPLPTCRTTQTQNKPTHVGFEPTIPAFERAKTVHALDRAGTVISKEVFYNKLLYGSQVSIENYLIINSEVIDLLSIRKASFCNIKLFANKFPRVLKTIGRHLNDELDK
jgi:hypothetical protein